MRLYVIGFLLFLGCTEAGFVDKELPLIDVKPNDDIAEPFAMSVGTVGRIIDGDTIVLDDEKKTKLRIAYIDCPEKSDPWFKEGCEFATIKLLGKEIKYFDLGPDKYRRTLAKVFYSPNNDVDIVDYGRQLVVQGLAKRYKEKQLEYVKDEGIAKSNKVGIWSESKDLPDTISSSESVSK